MSARWFRFYADAMRHPKVARLSASQFRFWVELLSVAAENDGHIPCVDDLKHVLKRRLDHVLRGLKDLIRAGLIDPLDDGYSPHGWMKRQYKSDVSTDRVKKFREKRNVSETAPDTETDTETDNNPPSPPRGKGVPVPDWIPPEAWAGFKAMRVKIRKPMTDRAQEMVINKLDELRKKGHDPGKVLDQSTMRCWQDVFELKPHKAIEEHGKKVIPM